MFKTMSTFFSCSSELSKTAKAPKLECPKHPNLLIKSFCLKTNCAYPYICSKCKIDHPADHRETFKKVNDVFNDKDLAFYARNLEGNFSSTKTSTIYESIINNITKVEQEAINIFKDLKEQVKRRFDTLNTIISDHRDAYTDYTEQLNASLGRSYLCTQEVKRLVKSYKRLRDDNGKILNLKLDKLPKTIDSETQTILAELKAKFLNNSKLNLELDDKDFAKLKVLDTLRVRNSAGILYNSCAYIPKSQVLAIGFKEGSEGSLGIFDLETKKLVATLHKIHKYWINHVLWVRKQDLIVTISNDSLIKVHKASLEKNQIKTVAILRAHTGRVRAIKCLEDENLLLSAGYDGGIKLWDLRRLRRIGAISTGSDLNIEGNLMYIAADKLVGAAFKTGCIKLYHLLKRNLVVQVKTGFSDYGIYGLQYLPKKKLVLANVSKTKVYVWKYESNKKKLTMDQTIDVNGAFPNCFLASEDEDQILYTTGKSFIEIYNLDTHKSAKYELPSSKVRGSNCIVPMEFGKVLVGDCYSENLFILG